MLNVPRRRGEREVQKVSVSKDIGGYAQEAVEEEIEFGERDVEEIGIED